MIEIPNIWIFVAFFLFVVSLIDIKYKAIPSFIMTSGVLGVAFINPQHFKFALILVLIGIIFYEISYKGQKFIYGIADLKAISMIGFVIGSQFEILLFILILAIMSISYQIILKRNFGNLKEIPFLPVFFLSFIALKFTIFVIGGEI